MPYYQMKYVYFAHCSVKLSILLKNIKEQLIAKICYFMSCYSNITKSQNFKSL